ncbi:hypothetical protein [Nonomuraea sp. NPDC050691]|uniref:hypothetical protein n=1 Tax=Nonomuraea sp. NPDC050691 TaxID=3155661 RepID=UPI0033D66A09
MRQGLIDGGNWFSLSREHIGPESYGVPGFSVTMPSGNELRNAFFRQAYEILGEKTADQLARKARYSHADLYAIVYFPGITLED